jgi:hypothetical protein
MVQTQPECDVPHPQTQYLDVLELAIVSATAGKVGLWMLYHYFFFNRGSYCFAV